MNMILFRRRNTLPALLAIVCTVSSIAAQSFNIRDRGAKGDRQVLDTAAIQKAVVGRLDFDNFRFAHAEGVKEPFVRTAGGNTTEIK